MNKTQYKFLWISTQVVLFILPMIIALFVVPYQISWDEHYTQTVNVRAFTEESPNKVTDLKEAVVSKIDAQGEYENKVWKLQHKELYYFNAIGGGFAIGLILQILNLVWAMFYGDLVRNDDDHDFNRRDLVGQMRYLRSE
jgi:hypothetical protein